MLFFGKIIYYKLDYFETVCYIFISFDFLLNKHFGSIITRLGFDFYRGIG